MGQCILTKSPGLKFLNYSSAVTLSAGSAYTCPSNGVVFVSFKVRATVDYTANVYFYINDKCLGRVTMGHSFSVGMPGEYLVSKGDKAKYTLGSGSEGLAVFVPFK